MAVTNRAAKLTKLHKVAKKHYQPVRPPSDRSVMEHLLYACCLENSQFEAADEAFARLQENFFDWNEVRVTTAVELAETMHGLSDPSDAAGRLKKTLHSLFETHYQFDIDHLRKENLGKAVQTISRYKGISPFVIAYVAQNGLGGHSIAVDTAFVRLMYVIGAIDEKETEKRQVPGLERAIPKTKGVEFFSLVHQLAVAFHTAPFNQDLRRVVLTIDSQAQERFPKRTRKKKVDPKKKLKTTDKAERKRTVEKAAAKSTSGSTKKKTAKKPATRKPSGPKPSATSSRKKPASKKAAKKKPGRPTKKKSPTKRLAKKKPR